MKAFSSTERLREELSRYVNDDYDKNKRLWTESGGRAYSGDNDLDRTATTGPDDVRLSDEMPEDGYQIYTPTNLLFMGATSRGKTSRAIDWIENEHLFVDEDSRMPTKWDFIAVFAGRKQNDQYERLREYARRNGAGFVVYDQLTTSNLNQNPKLNDKGVTSFVLIEDFLASQPQTKRRIEGWFSNNWKDGKSTTIATIQRFFGKDNIVLRQNSEINVMFQVNGDKSQHSLLIDRLSGEFVDKAKPEIERVINSSKYSCVLFDSQKGQLQIRDASKGANFRSIA